MGKMGPTSCTWVWRVILAAAILLADPRTFFNTFNHVSGMRSISHTDVKFPKSQLVFEQLQSSFSYTSNKGRKLTDSPNAGSSKGEVEALIAFKDSVTTDPLEALKSWSANDSNACSWTGVKCFTLSNNVAELDLGNLGLVGVVPQMIGFLNHLEYVDLLNNFLGGSIPNSISNCSNLSYLNVSYNQVNGEIPPQIGELSNLLILEARQNNLTGVIPEALGNCSMLETLVLGSNILEGSIPLTLGRLSNLHRLNLTYNTLSGTIPNTLGNCSYLTVLDLYGNYELGGSFLRS